MAALRLLDKRVMRFERSDAVALGAEEYLRLLVPPNPDLELLDSAYMKKEKRIMNLW